MKLRVTETQTYDVTNMSKGLEWSDSKITRDKCSHQGFGGSSNGEGLSKCGFNLQNIKDF